MSEIKEVKIEIKEINNILKEISNEITKLNVTLLGPDMKSGIIEDVRTCKSKINKIEKALVKIFTFFTLVSGLISLSIKFL